MPKLAPSGWNIPDIKLHSKFPAIPGDRSAFTSGGSNRKLECSHNHSRRWKRSASLRGRAREPLIIFPFNEDRVYGSAPARSRGEVKRGVKGLRLARAILEHLRNVNWEKTESICPPAEYSYSWSVYVSNTQISFSNRGVPLNTADKIPTTKSDSNFFPDECLTENPNIFARSLFN